MNISLKSTVVVVHFVFSFLENQGTESQKTDFEYTSNVSDHITVSTSMESSPHRQQR
jgi:hypothetical protein